jgi:hypothetical protein
VASIRILLGAAVVGLAVPASSFADPNLVLGNAGQYGIVSAGTGSSLTINSGPITATSPIGAILVGDGSTVTTSGGGNGQIVGTIADDGTVPQSAFGGLQTPPAAAQFSTVSAAYIQSAVASAQAVSTYAAGLTANVTYSSISSATTFSFSPATATTYVIDVGTINNAPLTFSGNANAFFVVNVSKNYMTNVANTLSGVSASQVLFNFTNTSGNVFQTSGGDVSQGTYLATNGGDFQFSNLNLTGALINTAGHIQFVSGSKMVAAPVPETESFAMFGVGLFALGALGRRRAFKR